MGLHKKKTSSTFLFNSIFDPLSNVVISLNFYSTIYNVINGCEIKQMLNAYWAEWLL